MLNEPLTVNEFKYPECIKLCSNSVWMHCPVCLFCVSLPLSNPYVCARVTRYVQCFCGFTPSLFCRVGCSCPFFKFMCLQATGWNVPLFLDWLMVWRTCWTSAQWIDSPSYDRVQRSERVNSYHNTVCSLPLDANIHVLIEIWLLCLNKSQVCACIATHAMCCVYWCMCVF